MNAVTERTYSGSARGVAITAERVIYELEVHGFTDADDVADCFASLPVIWWEGSPAHTMYDAGDVMDWLGY